LSMCRVVADQVQTEKCVSSFSSFLSILFTWSKIITHIKVWIAERN
jgi:hypothetical protein